MILIAGLVICSALFGYGGGVVAGVIMFFYTLYFFSRGVHARSFACASTLMTTRTFPADSARLVDSADGQTGNPYMFPVRLSVRTRQGRSTDRGTGSERPCPLSMDDHDPRAVGPPQPIGCPVLTERAWWLLPVTEERGIPRLSAPSSRDLFSYPCTYRFIGNG